VKDREAVPGSVQKEKRRVRQTCAHLGRRLTPSACVLTFYRHQNGLSMQLVSTWSYLQGPPMPRAAVPHTWAWRRESRSAEKVGSEQRIVGDDGIHREVLLLSAAVLLLLFLLESSWRSRLDLIKDVLMGAACVCTSEREVDKWRRTVLGHGCCGCACSLCHCERRSKIPPHGECPTAKPHWVIQGSKSRYSVP